MKSTPKGKHINSSTLHSNLGPARIRAQFLFVKKLETALSKLKDLQSPKLVEILESRSEALPIRLAAGQELAFRGDPRISTLSPQMIKIPLGLLKAGSHMKEISNCFSKYKKYGLLKSWLMKEYPRHTVQIKAFKMAKFPVTNFEYREYLMENSEGEIPSSWSYGQYPLEKSNHPVFGISLETAKNYAAWLSKKVKRNFRLPTEYEWEWAAQGPGFREYPWGNRFSKHLANTLELGLLGTSPVGAFSAGGSYHGVQDLGGNVEEYVSDCYFVYPNGKVVKDDLWKKTGGQYEMTRGGSFTRYADLARSKRRHGYFGGPLYPTGFRLAEDIS